MTLHRGVCTPNNTLDSRLHLIHRSSTFAAVHESACGPSRHIALPHELGRYRGKADVAFVASRRGFMGTRPKFAVPARRRSWGYRQRRTQRLSHACRASDRNHPSLYATPGRGPAFTYDSWRVFFGVRNGRTADPSADRSCLPSRCRSLASRAGQSGANARAGAANSQDTTVS
jgi:hypothetical protein